MKYNTFDVMRCDTIMPSFKERFLTLKGEKNVSLQEIAESINSNKASLSRYISGKVPIKLETAKLLADYFDVDQAYLLGESDVRKQSDIDRQKEKLKGAYAEVFEEAIDKKVPAQVLIDFIELYTRKDKK